MLVALALAVFIPTAANATTTFELASGSLSLTVDEFVPGDGLYRFADTLTFDIDSAQLVFDPDTQQIVSLEISMNSPTEFELLPGTPGYAGYTSYSGSSSLELESFAISVTDGTVIANGAGYSFDGDAFVNAAFGWNASEGGLRTSSNLSPMVSGDVADGPIFGNLMDDAGMISLNGVALGFFDSPLDDSFLVVTADFSLSASASAPIPEPDAMVLFIAGLLVAGEAARHRRLNGGTKHLR